MKKSRIFLTAALIITVATGAFALKAHRDGAGSLYCGSVQGVCSATTDYNPTGGNLSLYCSSVSQAACEQVTVKSSNIQAAE